MHAKAAIVREAGGPFLIEDIEVNAPEGDEILVRIKACGLCHTDLLIRDQLYTTPLPIVLGHEGAGVVEAVGPDVTTIKVGDHVGLSFAACDTCPSCANGRIAYCWHHMPANFSGHRRGRRANRGRADFVCEWDTPAPLRQGENRINGAFFQQSAFATHAIATERNAVVAPKDIPFSVLAPFGCGFQTGAGAVFNSLPVKPEEPFLVTGAGAVGMSAIMAARIVGADPIIAVDIVDARLSLAKELGATHAINAASTEDVGDAISMISPTGMATALETTGNPRVFRTMVDAMRPTGVAGLVAGAKAGTEVTFDMIHLLFGRTVKGILQGDSDLATFIPQLIDHHMNGDFPVDRLIGTFQFSDINSAAQAMADGSVIKPVLIMD